MPATKAEAEGNLIEVKKPKFLSLVDRPANKRAFVVVRSDIDTQGEKPMKPMIRRQRRADTQPVLAVKFPEGYTDAQVNETLTAWKLTGYNVTTENGRSVALRSDLKSISPDSTQEIRMTEDSVTVVVAKQAQTTQNPKSEVSIVRLEFQASKFTPDTVQEWLKGNGFDAVDVSQEEGQGSFLIERAELPEGEETRVIALEDGVSATIVRSDTCGCPSALAAAVNDTAYGHWGWGHLDFSMALADEEFCDHLSEASQKLREVLNNIMFYSSLGLADRKALLQNALSQYGEYVTNLIDQLPQPVIQASVARHDRPKKETEMTQAPAKSGTSAAQNTGNAGASNEPTIYVTRADFDAKFAELTDLITAQRSEPAKTEAPAAPAAPAAEPLTLEALRSDLTKLFAEAVEPLKERIEKVAGVATFVRNDTDTSTATPDGDKSNGQGTAKRADVWAKPIAPMFARK